ncbi:hypothetical protein P691DRAFT_643470, partial [Macrolepiota fuliginosa MF-IS2]
NEEKMEALTDAFFPGRPPHSTIPEDHQYLIPPESRMMINEAQVIANIQALAPHKAPSPDGIPNVVLQKMADLIVSYLVHIYKVILSTGHQYEGWKAFTMVVLGKPGKPSYEMPNAYRPIALLCTLGKVLTSIVTEEI